jgi:mono/diheme cytochrome c family protein
MKKWSVVFVATMVIFILVAIGCGPAATPTLDISKGKSVIESRCSTCHGLAQVQAAKNDLEGWQATVDRMVGRGAQLTPEQQQLVVKYLAKTYPKK